MTNWKEIRHQVQDRIRNVVRSSGNIKSQHKSKGKGKSKRKNKKKEITPQEAVALIGSIIVIIMALGGIGLIYNVFARLE